MARKGHGKVEDHETRLTVAEAEIDELQEDMAAVKNTLENHEGRIAANEAAIADHESRITANEGAIAALQPVVNELVYLV